MKLHELTYLVVDDLELMRAVTVNQLRALGCDKVKVARNGATALEMLRNGTIDVVLCDWNMPVMSGLELLKIVRADPKLAFLPFLMITAEAERDRIEEVIHAGVSGLLVKPYNAGNLRNRLEKVFQDRRNALLNGDSTEDVGIVGSPTPKRRRDFDATQEAANRRADAENITRHDIKGALAGVVGMVHSLAEDPAMDPRHVSQLRLVEQTAQQAIDLVNLSGELYKIEAGTFKLHAVLVDVGDILHRIVAVARTTFSEKRLTIEVDTDTPVGTELPQALGDAALTYSLFQNLVKNACEAAPADTRVSVALHDENPLRVAISNLGVVPQAMRDCFFDKFATSGKQGGSGIGTYSARLLARAQRGDIVMTTSDADNMTTITVTLPRQVFGSTSA